MKDPAPTQPPKEADKSAGEFERMIAARGEETARWENLMRMLEERWPAP